MVKTPYKGIIWGLYRVPTAGLLGSIQEVLTMSHIHEGFDAALEHEPARVRATGPRPWQAASCWSSSYLDAADLMI